MSGAGAGPGGGGRGGGRVIDISPRVAPCAPVWPGDTPYELSVAWSPDYGDSVTVSRLVLSPHTGAHADAPLHVGAGPADVASLPLEAFWGPCLVLDWRGRALIDAPDLEAAAVDWSRVERALFRTWERPPEAFPATFPAFTPDGAAYLAGFGAGRGGPLRLVGIDTFSVDVVDSKDLRAHRALLGAGIQVLEGLDLSAAEPGAYELVALPLRLAGSDASPVRAALRPLGG